MNKLFYIILASVSLIFLIVCINLNSRINDLKTKVSDLEWTVQEHEISIERLTDRNNAQDVILNKLNSEYQMREKQRAEELKEVAELNGVGG
uniref:Septum formation initiator n=1 Tax=Siphoviridae sp. ctM4S20 TaxID=2825458 RepID=A0A8S5P797_9CAUD|nr:MAG TPA: Septum formation initiator [Siphoviridae sp. ctM4S20]